jgi:methylglutaconyl-CoA hydratase
MQSNLIQVKADQDSRVLILSSSVQKVFCAGADLKERALMSQDEVKSFVQKLQATFNMLEDLEIPTIACIDGFALGGGLEMALACDLRVAGPNARVGLVETSIGVIPGAGGTFRLPRAIGLAKAKEMIFTSAIYDSEQAKALDLFSYIGEEPLAKALEIASLICQNAPVAVKMAKKSVNLAFGLDRTRAMTIEGLCYAQIVNTEDRVEALNAFKEKRKPVFKGK